MNASWDAKKEISRVAYIIFLHSRRRVLFPPASVICIIISTTDLVRRYMRLFWLSLFLYPRSAFFFLFAIFPLFFFFFFSSTRNPVHLAIVCTISRGVIVPFRVFQWFVVGPLLLGHRRLDHHRVAPRSALTRAVYIFVNTPPSSEHPSGPGKWLPLEMIYTRQG